MPAMRLVVCCLGVLAASGCATPLRPVYGAGYHTVEQSPGCSSYVGKPGTIDRVLELDSALADSLLKQLTHQPLPEPLCWYLKPAGEIELHAGPMCGGPLVAHFALQGHQWLKTDEDMPLILCHYRRRTTSRAPHCPGAGG